MKLRLIGRQGLGSPWRLLRARLNFAPDRRSLCASSGPPKRLGTTFLLSLSAERPVSGMRGARRGIRYSAAIGRTPCRAVKRLPFCFCIWLPLEGLNLAILMAQDSSSHSSWINSTASQASRGYGQSVLVSIVALLPLQMIAR
jgi:hypothetical protein